MRHIPIIGKSGQILKTMLRLFKAIGIITTLTFWSCTGIGMSGDGPARQEIQNKPHETYLDIRNTLETSGDKIDYDTLIYVYNAISGARHPIPHLDQLLTSLIYKRNDNPRIDQMILIFSARAIGAGKFPVKNVYDIFESILKFNDDRLNEWVISFVAAAIGNYPFDIPDGDKLVNLLEKTLDRVESAPAGSKEYFGFHFLPPPRSDFIRSYIAGIKDQRKRETERFYYYSLIQDGIPEVEIAGALKHIMESGMPGTSEKCQLPMKYLILNVYNIR